MPNLIPDAEKEDIITTITHSVIHEPYTPAIDALKHIQRDYLTPASTTDRQAILEDFIAYIRNAHSYLVNKAAKGGLAVARKLNAVRFKQNTNADGTFIDPMQESRYHDLRIIISLGDLIYGSSSIKECAHTLWNLLNQEFSIHKVYAKPLIM